MTSKQVKIGEKIVNDLVEKKTLTLINTGSESSNYRILSMLPTTITNITDELSVSVVAANRRVNELEERGLVKRVKSTGEVKTGTTTKSFINLIEGVKKQVKTEMVRLVEVSNK